MLGRCFPLLPYFQEVTTVDGFIFLFGKDFMLVALPASHLFKVWTRTRSILVCHHPQCINNYNNQCHSARDYSEKDKKKNSKMLIY